MTSWRKALGTSCQESWVPSPSPHPHSPVTFSNEKNLSELGQSKKNRVRGLLVVRLTLLCHPKLSLTKSLSVLLTALLAYFPGNDWAPR